MYLNKLNTEFSLSKIFTRKRVTCESESVISKLLYKLQKVKNHLIALKLMESEKRLNC